MPWAGLQFLILVIPGQTILILVLPGQTIFLHQIPLMSFDCQCSVALLHGAVVCLHRVIVVFPDIALTFLVMLSGPRRQKTCPRGFRQREIQTSLLSYKDYVENRNSTCSTFTYDNFQNVNNKGADQTAQMRRLVCACVVRKPPKTGFLTSRPNSNKGHYNVSIMAKL